VCIIATISHTRSTERHADGQTDGHKCLAASLFGSQ